MAETFDVVVVGLGAMGAATIYQLAKRGVRVLGIDQFDPPHAFGSSHGETRMTRAACAEGFIFTRLAQRYHQLWRAIEEEAGAPESLLTLNGQLVISGPDASSSHGVRKFLGDTKEQAEKASIPHDYLSSEAVRARFPAFAIQDDENAYHDALSGFVRPELCITTQLSLARAHGAMTRTNERVTKIVPSGSSVTITTSAEKYSAASVVLTTGPWLPEMLPAKESERFSVKRQVLYWFAVRPDQDLAMFRADRFPAFLWFMRPPKLLIYGFPALGTAREGIKIATEEEIITTPDKVDRRVSEKEKQSFFETYLRSAFPALSAECVRAEVCLYTTEKATGKRFVVDRHPDMANVVCVSACSGHGFKHSPAIGELVADMVMTPGHQGLPQFRWQYDGVL